MNEEMIEWLKFRAEQETAKIKQGMLSRLRYFFADYETIQKNKEEAAKSLGKVEMIAEIINHYNEKNK